MDRSDQNFLQLPVGAVGRIDVGRLVREVEAIDGFLKQSEIRQPGTPTKLPKTSKLMDELILLNKFNVLHEEERTRLASFLKTVYRDAPLLHISFSADPSPLFMQKLMTWIRQEIHPLALVQVGLQPNIGAGCVVRTKNKYFDMSLRTRFSESRTILATTLKAVAATQPQQPAAAATTSQGAAK